MILATPKRRAWRRSISCFHFSDGTLSGFSRPWTASGDHPVDRSALHEFVPHDRAKQQELARELNLDVETVARRVEQLHEANPMLGHRGCRLCITYPEILEMQVRAIIEAAIECQKKRS